MASTLTPRVLIGEISGGPLAPQGVAGGADRKPAGTAPSRGSARTITGREPPEISQARTAGAVPRRNTLATATKTATKLQPLGDRVVVKPTPREEMTKSGIVLPDTAKEKPQEGTILAVGPGAFDNDGKRIAMDVSVGQKVLYGKYAGTEFKLDDDELLIVSQKDILAVVAD
jgi:chaperonin GroES